MKIKILKFDTDNYKMNNYSKTLKSAAFSVFRILFLLAISYIIIYPLLYMISTSLKTAADFQDPSVLWIPKVFSNQNYKNALSVINFKKSIFSTVRLELVSAVIETVTCAITAYGLARFNFPGKKILSLLLIFLILVPNQMIVIPMSINYSYLDFLGILKLIGGFIGKEIRPSIIDTVWCFYLPSIFSVGFKSGILIYIYHQFFKGLPKELEEAAWIDGSNPFRTFVQIALPSSSVAILTVFVLAVVWHWNDYYLAVMYTSENFPLAVSLAMLQENLGLIGLWPNNPLNGAAVMAGCTMFVLPILIVYLFIQKNFVKSIDRVGITG